jgi:hypothetical protein
MPATAPPSNGGGIASKSASSGRHGDTPASRGQVLVVAKTGAADGGEACHVAYIDALANADANVLAVKAADELAESFDCAKGPVTIGSKGKSPLALDQRI